MTTLDSFIIYDDAATHDDLPSEDLHTVEGMRRRREAMEARRPPALGRDMLRLDRQAFLTSTAAATGSCRPPGNGWPGSITTSDAWRRSATAQVSRQG